MKVTGIILAGGKSRRLGRNKVLESVSGKTLIQCVFERLKPAASQILIVTSQENRRLAYPEGADILVDDFPGKGPLSGIYTGLSAARYEYSIVVACDMPLLNTKLLRYLVDRSRGFDAVVPRLNPEIVEPLHAVYSKRCLNAMKAQLETSCLDMRSLLERLNVRYISPEECRETDHKLESFININNQDDLDKATAAVTRSA